MIYLAAHFFDDVPRARRAIEPAGFSPDTARSIDSVAERCVFPLVIIIGGEEEGEVCGRCDRSVVETAIRYSGD